MPKDNKPSGWARSKAKALNSQRAAAWADYEAGTGNKGVSPTLVNMRQELTDLRAEQNDISSGKYAAEIQNVTAQIGATRPATRSSVRDKRQAAISTVKDLQLRLDKLYSNRNAYYNMRIRNLTNRINRTSLEQEKLGFPTGS